MTELRRTYDRRGRRTGGAGSRTPKPIENKNRGRKQKHRSPAGIVFLLAALAFLAVCGYVFLRKYGPGCTWADYETVYGMGAEGTAVFYNGVQAEGTAVTRNDRIYVPDGAASEADSRWYLSDEGLLLYSLADETVEIQPSSTSYTRNGAVTDVGYEIFFVEEGTAYISVDFMESFAGVKVSSFPADEAKGIPARLYLDSDWGTHEQAQAAGKTAVRVLAGIKSPILTKTKKGSTLQIVDSVDDWTRVRTEDGFIGYVKTSQLKNREEYELTSSVSLPEYTTIHLNEPVCMAWHQVFSAADNEKLSVYLEGTEGINVLSPTWFSVTDHKGTLDSLADASYVAQAHEQGIQVWALIDDFNTDVDDLTLLSSTAARKNMIDQLLAAASDTGFDGINLDFESIKQDSASHYLQFVRELSIACRKAGLVFSIDNYSSGRSWYNLREEGMTADYIAIMGYTEHYKGCCSGTNASLSFSENGIKTALQYVPADKVINGLPVYMRLWKETPEENAGADETLYEDGKSVYDGKYARDSRAISMSEAQSLIAEHGVTPEWDDSLGQYYAQYEEDGSTYRIWVEDVKSLELKMQKVQQYGIAGAAFWKLGLETSDVWPMIGTYLQK